MAAINNYRQEEQPRLSIIKGENFHIKSKKTKKNQTKGISSTCHYQRKMICILKLNKPQKDPKPSRSGGFETKGKKMLKLTYSK